MRDNILKKARILRNVEFDNRIPFLKAAFNGQATCGPTAEVRSAIPYRVGKVMTSPDFASVRYFNSLKASQGLQAVSVCGPEDAILGIKVVECKVEWFGDLRIIQVPGCSETGDNEGYYDNTLFQIVVTEMPPPRLARAIVHELEHAAHCSLSFMSGFANMGYIDVAEAEYLSMLKELMADAYTGTLGQALLYRSIHINHSAKHLPTVRASDRLASWLKKLYDITDISFPCMDAPTIMEIKRIAELEYGRVYERLFGLALEDIREVVANLPLVPQVMPQRSPSARRTAPPIAEAPSPRPF